MDCENKACIYWEDKRCALDEISVDYCGRCSECVIYAKYETQRVIYEDDEAKDDLYE